MRANTPNTWSLIIATLNRESELKISIALAAAQSRRPKEIIIVDASSNWMATRDEIAKILAPQPKITLIYLDADERSLTVQRNQGIAAATSDVVFLFDDDTFMHPDCAAEIMRIYEADTNLTLAGVQADLSEVSPHCVDAVDVSMTRRAVGGAQMFSDGFRSSAIVGWLWRELFLMDAGKLFIPYHQSHWPKGMGVELTGLDIDPVRLFHGCRMTFRREIVVAEPFESLFLSYSPGEDLDCSYRASRHGALVTSRRAKVHHFETASSRINRYKVSLLQALNQALCIRRHATDLERTRACYYSLMRRRLLAEFLKDSLSGRCSLPQFRGLISAIRRSPQIFRMTDDELARHYPEIQRRILES